MRVIYREGTIGTIKTSVILGHLMSSMAYDLMCGNDGQHWQSNDKESNTNWMRYH